MADERTCTFTFLYRGASIQVSMEADGETTMGALGRAVSSQAGLDFDTVKFIVKGSTLVPKAEPMREWKSTALYPPAGQKILLVASPMGAVEAVQSSKELHGLPSFEYELRRAALRMRPSTSASSAFAPPSGQYTFQNYKVLETPGLKPVPKEALRLLYRLASDEGIKAVMAAHSWSVGTLSEMHPEGKVGVSAICILGFNRNRGQEISLRLRTDDLKGFRKYERIRETLIHELAHMEFNEHDNGFKALNSQLTREVYEALASKGHGSHRLGPLDDDDDGLARDNNELEALLEEISMDQDVMRASSKDSGKSLRQLAGDASAHPSSSGPGSCQEAAATAALLRMTQPLTTHSGLGGGRGKAVDTGSNVDVGSGAQGSTRDQSGVSSLAQHPSSIGQSLPSGAHDPGREGVEAHVSAIDVEMEVVEDSDSLDRNHMPVSTRTVEGAWVRGQAGELAPEMMEEDGPTERDSAAAAQPAGGGADTQPPGGGADTGFEGRRADELPAASCVGESAGAGSDGMVTGGGGGAGEPSDTSQLAEASPAYTKPDTGHVSPVATGGSPEAGASTPVGSCLAVGETISSTAADSSTVVLDGLHASPVHGGHNSLAAEGPKIQLGSLPEDLSLSMGAAEDEVITSKLNQAWSALQKLFNTTPEVPATLVALEVLSDIISNVQRFPKEQRYRQIRMHNKAFHTKAGQYSGSLDLLLLAGFSRDVAPKPAGSTQAGSEQVLKLTRDDPGLQWLVLSVMEAAKNVALSSSRQFCVATAG